MTETKIGMISNGLAALWADCRLGKQGIAFDCY